MEKIDILEAMSKVICRDNRRHRWLLKYRRDRRKKERKEKWFEC